eukprot:5549429-Prymnesium_polylepis.1
MYGTYTTLVTANTSHNHGLKRMSLERVAAHAQRGAREIQAPSWSSEATDLYHLACDFMPAAALAFDRDDCASQVAVPLG